MWEKSYIAERQITFMPRGRPRRRK